MHYGVSAHEAEHVIGQWEREMLLRHIPSDEENEHAPREGGTPRRAPDQVAADLDEATRLLGAVADAA
jgi:hypothetical protein